MDMTYLFSLCLLILALWLASEIVGRDLSSPPPKDPYRLDRWRRGEGGPDRESIASIFFIHCGSMWPERTDFN